MKLRPGARGVLVAAVSLVVSSVAACSSRSSGGGGSFASTVAPSTSTTSPATTPTSTAPATSSVAAQPAPDVIPLVCIHGITGDPTKFDRLLELYGQGRARVPALYAAEADQLKPGDLPRNVVVSAGYYQESATSTLYDPDVNGVGQDSIGGCPSPRTDPYAANYKFSYVDRVERIVEGVRRATGSDRVDLAMHSMGNLVGRAYVRWHSDGALGGKSKARKLWCIAGPQRGINAIEAFSVGYVRPQPELFMRQGEIAEMCEEYPVFSGESFVDRLNDGWDAYCAQADVSYGGITGTGAFGGSLFSIPGLNIGPTINAIVTNTIQALLTGSTGDLQPYWLIAQPNVWSEVGVALSKTDGVVRLSSSRFDQPPFARAVCWGPFEGTHDDPTDMEQSVLHSTVTLELARQFIEGTVSTGAALSSATLALEDAPGHASWLSLDTTAVGGDLGGAQLVEQTLDASGNVVGSPKGYATPVHEGSQRAFFQVPAGGGDRRYHLVVYGANGPLSTTDTTLHLTDGPLDTAPATSFVGATPTTTTGGCQVHATFASNASASDPTLAFSYRLDAGAWTSWTASASFDTPALLPGEHRLEARSRQSSNGAGVLVEDARGVAVGLYVDASGALTVRP